ncbi:hypothetical protein DL93DRAFT_291789 [Clavulina sp. PMI_390]|nr:hypothetical protein DL93DRAFT_291789 [Clavulina sp. PMI_390]
MAPSNTLKRTLPPFHAMSLRRNEVKAALMNSHSPSSSSPGSPDLTSRALAGSSRQTPRSRSRPRPKPSNSKEKKLRKGQLTKDACPPCQLRKLKCDAQAERFEDAISTSDKPFRCCTRCDKIQKPVPAQFIRNLVEGVRTCKITVKGSVSWDWCCRFKLTVGDSEDDEPKDWMEELRGAALDVASTKGTRVKLEEMMPSDLRARVCDEVESRERTMDSDVKDEHDVEMQCEDPAFLARSTRRIDAPSFPVALSPPSSSPEYSSPSPPSFDSDSVFSSTPNASSHSLPTTPEPYLSPLRKPWRVKRIVPTTVPSKLTPFVTIFPLRANEDDDYDEDRSDSE